MCPHNSCPSLHLLTQLACSTLQQMRQYDVMLTVTAVTMSELYLVRHHACIINPTVATAHWHAVAGKTRCGMRGCHNAHALADDAFTMAGVSAAGGPHRPVEPHGEWHAIRSIHTLTACS